MKAAAFDDLSEVTITTLSGTLTGVRLPAAFCRSPTAFHGGFVPDFRDVRSFVFIRIGGFVFLKAFSAQLSATGPSTFYRSSLRLFFGSAGFSTSQQVLSFHQHRGISKISVFVFINIVGSSHHRFSRPFVFINIVGSTFIFDMRARPRVHSDSLLGPPIAFVWLRWHTAKSH